MVPGINDLRSAHGFLASQDLEQAALCVWSAALHVKEWPSDLQHQADELLDLMFENRQTVPNVKHLPRADLDNLRVRVEETIGLAEQTDAT